MGATSAQLFQIQFDHVVRDHRADREAALTRNEVVQRRGWRALWALSGPTALRETAFYLPYYVAFEETHGAVEAELLQLGPASSAGEVSRS